MDSNKCIEKVAEGIKCSVLMFELPENQHVLFIPYTDVRQVNKYISFSAIVNLAQASYYEEKLSLKLIKLNENGDFQTFTLSNINLNREGDKDYQFGDSQELSILPNDPFPHKRIYRYEFQNVPVPGSGRYGLAVVYEAGDSIYPFDCFYFNVV